MPQAPADERYGAKFGLNEAVGTTFETIWLGGGLYPWRTTGATLSLSSDDAADTTQKFRIEGIRDKDWSTPYEAYTVDVTANGTTPVSIDAGEILTADRARLLNGYSTPAGAVYVYAGTATAGVPDDLGLMLAKVNAGCNSSEQCVISCPAGKVLGVLGFGAGSSGFIQWAPAWRSPDSSGSYGGFIQGPAGEQSGRTTVYNFPVPLSPGSRNPSGELDETSYLGPGSQFELRAKTDQSTKRVVGIIHRKWLQLP